MKNLIIVLGLFFSVAVSAAVGAQESESRTWSDDTGKFKLVAKMEVSPDVKLKSDVTLIKPDGSTVTVPFQRLSLKCQGFAQQYRRAARKSRDEAMKPKPDENDKKNDDKKADPDQSDSKVWNWRGPNQDGIADEANLKNDWDNQPPKLLWSTDGLGNGMSSLAIADGKIFTMGNIGGTEYLIARRLKDGSELWSTRVGSGGNSNCTPTVAGKLVYAIGFGGDLVCADCESGDEVWRKSFANDFGGKMMSQWGYSESPLVDGDRLICTPGGPNAMIVALDRKTGKRIWATPMKPGGNRGTDGAGYASVVISNGGGVKQYITLVGRGLISVAAKDGRPLWQYEKIANATANVPTPIVDGDFVFCSSGYDDGGTALLQLSGNRGSVSIRERYYQTANQLQNHHGGMVKIGDYVYMGEGHNQGFPMCVEFLTGKKMWPKGRGAGSGSAAIVAADGHLYFRYENGVMALIEANPSEYKLKGSFQVATNLDRGWPHPVVFEGKLYLRDKQKLHCYDVSAK